MSSFWSNWIIVITLLTIAANVWILFSNRTRENSEKKTTGHYYDGIVEYDNPLPSWWFNLFVATVIFGLIYLLLFPAMGNFKGLLNWTSSKQWQEEVQIQEETFLSEVEPFMQQKASDLISDKKAISMGKAIFKSNCAVCHGSDAMGSFAFPDLTDNDWLYGGSEETIKQTISRGRNAVMPAWEKVLGDNVEQMADYVQNITKADIARHPMHKNYQQICASCHASDGTGKQMLGAPNLTDHVWLYNGSIEDISNSIAKGRQGKMPAFAERLSKEKIHLLSAYILSLSAAE